MADRTLDLPLPLNGENLDTSPSQIDPTEAAALYNALLHEPGQMRARLGWKRMVDLTPFVGASEAPVSSLTWNGTRMMVGVVTNPDLFLPAFYKSPFVNTPAGYGLTPTGRAVGINADVPGSETTAEHILVAPARMPFGQSNPYEGSVYCCSIAAFSALARDGATVSGTRLMRWAGESSDVASVAASATLNNGATVGSFAAGPSRSLKNWFLTFDSDSPPYKYGYQIIAHTAGDTAFTISKPYGLGETAANVGNKAGAACVVAPYVPIVNSPINAQCVAVYHDRLFIARGDVRNSGLDIVPGAYPNSIHWSSPGEPEKWPIEQVALVDEEPNAGITGFGFAGKNLLIFKPNSIYSLSGSDETTFLVNLVTNEVGCIDPRSIIQYRDRCIFGNRRGIYAIDSGYGITELSHNKTGHGIRRAIQPKVTKDNRTSSKYQHLQLSSVLVDDYLIVAAQDNRPAGYGALEDGHMMYIPTQAWTTFGNRDANLEPFLFSPANQYLSGRSVAVFRTFCATLPNVIKSEDPLTAGNDRYDEHYAGGLPATAYVPFEVRWKDYIVASGNTARIRGAQVDHNVHHVGVTEDANMVGLELAMSVDPHIDDGSLVTGVIRAPYAGSVPPAFDKYVVQTFAQPTFPKPGSTFRVRIRNDHAAGLSRPHSTKLFTVRLLIEDTTDGRKQPVTLV